jgi:hypothetical protein
MILATVGFAVIWLVMKYVQALGIIPFSVMPQDVGFWFIFVGWLGAMFPDFDHDWKPFMGHRAWITHSFVMPLIFVAAVWLPLRWIWSGVLLGGTPLWGIQWWSPLDRFFIAIFFTGCACHLLTDLIPSTKSILNRFSKSPKEGIAYIERSLVAAPGNITKVPEKYERPWLIGNGILLIIFAIIVWWSPFF